MPIRIMCYGDSNTWGFTPGTGVRYDEDTRWTGRLQKILGENFTILEEGLNGRSTVFDNPVCPYQNGLKGLGFVLLAAKPLDIVVVCLGINDFNYTGVAGSVQGINEIMRTLHNANYIYAGNSPVFRTKPRVLLVSPAHLHPEFDVYRTDSKSCGHTLDSQKLAPLYKQVADNYGAWFLDAADYAKASEDDYIHLDVESHARLAEAIASKIHEICAEEGL